MEIVFSSTGKASVTFHDRGRSVINSSIISSNHVVGLFTAISIFPSECFDFLPLSNLKNLLTISAVPKSLLI